MRRAFTEEETDGDNLDELHLSVLYTVVSFSVPLTGFAASYHTWLTTKEIKWNSLQP